MTQDNTPAVKEPTLRDLFAAKVLLDACGGDVEIAKASVDAAVAIQFAVPPPRVVEFHGVITMEEIREIQDDFDAHMAAEDVQTAPASAAAVWAAAEEVRTAKELERWSVVQADRESAEEHYIRLRMAQPWASVMKPNTGTVEDFVRVEAGWMSDYTLADAINRLEREAENAAYTVVETLPIESPADEEEPATEVA